MENEVNFAKNYYSKVGKSNIIQLITNILLTVIKLFGGIFASSSALLSDGIDSFGDCLTSLVSSIANKKASKKADKDHQFGHEKIENFVTFLFSLFIIFSGIYLIYEAIESMINGDYKNDLSPNLIYALIISFIAIFVKIVLGVLVFFNYKKTKSPLLKAQSLDHFLDSIATFLTCLTLLILFFNQDNIEIRILDPIVSIIIALIILSGGIRIFIDNSASLLDKACSKELSEKIKNQILSIDGVLHIDLFRSRIASNRIFIEVEVSVDDNLSLKKAHDIAENIKEEIIKNNNEVKGVSVHINPYSHKDQNNDIF